MNNEADEDEDDFAGQFEESDSRFDENDGGKSNKQRVGKRKIKEMNRSAIPSKLMKQMRTLLDVLIKYRDKFVIEYCFHRSS